MRELRNIKSLWDPGKAPSPLWSRAWPRPEPPEHLPSLVLEEKGNKQADSDDDARQAALKKQPGTDPEQGGSGEGEQDAHFGVPMKG